jgi:NAD(P)H-hydrate epimerase
MKRLSSLDLPGLPRRSVSSHKGSAGRILVVAGSKGMSGAAYLAASGAFGVGAGYVRVACPESIYSILATLCPAAVFTLLQCDGAGRVLPGEAAKVLDLQASSDVAVVGPGLGEDDSAGEFFARVADGLSLPAVFDASALALLAGMEGAPSSVAGSVMTPHAGEAARLLGVTVEEVRRDREASAGTLSERFGAVVVLKGERTLVCDGDRIYENMTGNAGMASAGTGDVLAGVVGALIPQGLAAFGAACLGAYLHGRAGDAAARQKGRALGAEDVAAMLPGVLREYEGGRFERGGAREH